MSVAKLPDLLRRIGYTPKRVSVTGPNGRVHVILWNAWDAFVYEMVAHHSRGVVGHMTAARLFNILYDRILTDSAHAYYFVNLAFNWEGTVDGYDFWRDVSGALFDLEAVCEMPSEEDFHNSSVFRTVGIIPYPC